MVTQVEPNDPWTNRAMMTVWMFFDLRGYEGVRFERLNTHKAMSRYMDVNPVTEPI
jgi:hypothetical protein